MYFAPFIVRAEHERKVPVVIERATAEDLKLPPKYRNGRRTGLRNILPMKKLKSIL